MMMDSNTLTSNSLTSYHYFIPYLLSLVFDGLLLTCSYLLSLDVKVIVWVMLCKALEAKD